MNRAVKGFESSEKSVREGRETVEARKFLNVGSINDVSC